MASPTRAARRRAAREAAQVAQQDPAFAEQMQAQQREQAINGLVEQHESAMAALGLAIRDRRLFEAEADRLRQLAAQLAEENEGLLADLEASDTDISDACAMIERLVDVEHDTDDRPGAIALLARLRPADPAEAPTLEAVPEPNAASNGAGDVAIEDLAELD